MALPNEIPAAQAFDAIVFAVPHDEYVDLDLVGWLGGATPLIIDSNEVLKREQREALAGSGCRIWSIGRGVHQQ
jgi:UDP-N-acetyl-D-mannosaminuronate dehydrogenase